VLLVWPVVQLVRLRRVRPEVPEPTAAPRLVDAVAAP
jgi:hypothetical protein